MLVKENTIKVISPAKVNLFLAVGQKNGNYHPVLNVMHTLLLHDVLFFNFEKSNKLQINIQFLENEDSNGQIPNIKTEDNLIYKALKAVGDCATNNNYKIDVYVEKNIPLKAGLAGGSSNAAAALLAASKIFGISIDSNIVTKIAEEIGSDVGFFLKGGCALYTGRGQIFDHKIQPVNREIVLIRPFNDKGLSTKDVYQKFDTLNIASDLDKPFPNNAYEQNSIRNNNDANNQINLKDAVKQLNCADSVPLFNNLAVAAEQLNKDLAEVKTFLDGICGKENVLLCGSGSTTFAFVPEDKNVEDIIQKAKHHGFWAISTQLANIKVKIAPNTVQY